MQWFDSRARIAGNPTQKFGFLITEPDEFLHQPELHFIVFLSPFVTFNSSFVSFLPTILCSSHTKPDSPGEKLLAKELEADWTNLHIKRELIRYLHSAEHVVIGAELPNGAGDDISCVLCPHGEPKCSCMFN